MLRVCTGVIIGSVGTGCSSTGTVTRPPSASLVADEEALALPPPGGPAIVGVVERSRANGLEQTISLATTARVSGQNHLKIEFYGADVSSGPSAAFRTINEREILREAAAAIPGVRLSRRSAFLQNTYGPFAYAAGRSAFGDTCIYAWQQIRAGTAAQGIGRNFGMIQVRWRLCDAFAGEHQLLSAVYGYTITGTFDGPAWNPFGEPNRADSRLGKTGYPIYPTDGGALGGLPMGYAGGIDPRRTSAIADHPSRRSARPSQPAPKGQPQAKGPSVPRPDQVATQAAADPSGSAQQRETVKRPAVAVPSPEAISTSRP
ncbi:MAG: cellulose biosynthesis protein BcsN [Alphaproteobacteria bacterium]|nr:cellulose biosynthesis protein BcsN [Alphaproteobacteria bacterium]MBU1552965.1 cellulose biosynthesis protein BcsN [Alphaproteobacteria bacterium]MBU2338275.1 cellulose biosynthesis protein BcsN [Alphaproteobacteria bacterium]MBU2388254.1 cellulose biosynthesis protein BcsN [Alphaproteobacteria bacterium]